MLKQVGEAIYNKIGIENQDLPININIPLFDEADNKKMLYKYTEEALFASKRQGRNPSFDPTVYNRQKSIARA